MMAKTSDVRVNNQDNIATKGETIVSVVIPIRNEETYIAKCLDSVMLQDYPKEHLEINLVDGMSEDRTEEIAREYAEKYPYIHLYQNPNKTVPYAMNIGIRNAVGSYVIRLDAHAEYATDYVSKCVEYLEKTGAFNVGGPAIAIGTTNIQKAVAAAYHSKFAMGGGKYHDVNFEGYADTVWPGAFKKSTLISIGMYNTQFTRNEDDELNFRILQNHGKVYITPEIKCRYYPRKCIPDLFRQYFEFGFWKPAVIREHKKPARMSHLAPVTFVLFILVFGAAAFFSNIAAYTLLSVLLLYATLDTYFSFSSKYAENIEIKLLLCFVHVVLHISYGFGFFAGIFRLKRNRTESPTLTE